MKELFAEYLANRPPSGALTWLNSYWEKLRPKIFSTDNLLHEFVTPKGTRDMDFTLPPHWITFTSLVGMGSMNDISITACGLAVIAPLKLFVLQPRSYKACFVKKI